MRSRCDCEEAGGRRALLAGLALAGLAPFILALLAIAPAAHAASGDLAWQRVYNGPSNGADQFLAAAPAPNRGVYVAGWTGSNSGDFLVARYDGAGQRRWLRTYNGPNNDEDIAHAAAADALGNLIVAGYVNDANMVVIKYNPNGRRRWVRIYDDPASSQEVATNVAVDGAGNVYVLGWRVAAASLYDIVLVKYSPAGARRWARHYTGAGMNTDRPAGIAIDGSGNIYITGQSWGAIYSDVVTLKYDPAGHRRWVRLWDGPAGGDDFGNAIVVSSAGSVYVVGQTAGISSALDAVALKYTTNGTLKWSRSRTSVGTFLDVYSGVALCSNGDVVAVGTYYGGSTNNGDALLVRFAPSGCTRWVRTYNGPDSLDDEGLVVARNPSGAVFVAGESVGTVTGGDVLTLKYSGVGAFRWARRHTSAGINFDFTQALAVNDGVYVAGYEYSVTGSDAMLLKYVP